MRVQPPMNGLGAGWWLCCVVAVCSVVSAQDSSDSHSRERKHRTPLDLTAIMPPSGQPRQPMAGSRSPALPPAPSQPVRARRGGSSSESGSKEANGNQKDESGESEDKSSQIDRVMSQMEGALKDWRTSMFG